MLLPSFSHCLIAETWHGLSHRTPTADSMVKSLNPKTLSKSAVRTQGYPRAAMLSYPRVSDMTTPAQASPAFGDLFAVSSVTYVRHAQIKVIPNVLRAPLHSYKSFTQTVVPMHKGSYAALDWMAYSNFPFVVKNHTKPKKELHGTHGYTPEINHYLGLRPCFAPPLAKDVFHMHCCHKPE